MHATALSINPKMVDYYFLWKYHRQRTVLAYRLPRQISYNAIKEAYKLIDLFNCIILYRIYYIYVGRIDRKPFFVTIVRLLKFILFMR